MGDKKWYVVHTYSGYEEKVAQTLRHMLEHGQLDENIAEIVVPYELRLESVKGKKRTVPRKMYPGYVLVNMNLTNQNRLLLKQVQGVIGFIGSENTPQPLSETRSRCWRGPSPRPSAKSARLTPRSAR